MMRKSLFAVLTATLGVANVAAAAGIFDAEVGETVVVPAFRYDGEKSFASDLVFKRIDVYAPDARIYVIDKNGTREVPRSSRLVFVTDKQATGTRAYFTVDPYTSAVDGGVLGTEAGPIAFQGKVVDGVRLSIDKSERKPDEVSPFSCGGGLPTREEVGLKLPTGASERVKTSKAASRTAVIAIDTDKELLSRNFGDDEAAATTYLAGLFAGMNTMYERDLDLTLTQGTTLLRVGTDPYGAISDTTATSTQLNAFGEHWRTQRSNVSRTLAAQISGKGQCGCSSAGIAWVLNTSNDNYCANTGELQGSNTVGGFSVTRVLNGVNTAGNVVCGGTSNCSSLRQNPTFMVGIVGHEIGHNFGARHTHCTDVNGATPLQDVATNTIDGCFNQEAGCYAGVPTCPTDNSIVGQGSVMSYCNFRADGNGNGGAACTPNQGQVLNEFHPTHQEFLLQRIAENVALGCITGAVSNIGPNIAAQNPQSGTSTALGGGDVGAIVSGSISFSASGGSGTGTTSLTCSVGSGAVTIASGTPQTIGVDDAVAAVVPRFTLTDAAQTGVINCTATPQGGTPANFTYTFTVLAGNTSGGEAECTGDCVFVDGFEQQP